MPEKYPKENTLCKEHGESLKLKNTICVFKHEHYRIGQDLNRNSAVLITHYILCDERTYALSLVHPPHTQRLASMTVNGN